MKLFLLKKILFSLFFVSLLFSCEENIDSADILTQAQESAKLNSEKALNLLNTIANPETMSEEDYMKYIVTLVYTKHETKQDITADTLIYEAQRYFGVKDETKAALADFCAGWVYYKNNKPDKSITSFMLSETNAQKIADYTLAGRSSNNVGYIYYEQEIMDSAVVYYQKALDYYEKGQVADTLILKTLTNIGRVYEEENKFDEAYEYFTKSLELAKRINYQGSQIMLKNNLGFACYKRGNYTKAKELLHDALLENSNTKYLTKVYLNLAMVYNSTNQFDSAQYFCNLLKTEIPAISDKYLLKATYGAFSRYYKQTGDNEQSLYYADMESRITKKIKEESKALQVYEASMKVYLEHKKRELEKSKMRSDFYLLGAFCVLVLVLFYVVSIVRTLRISFMEESKEAKMTKYDYYRRIQNLFKLQNTYLDTIISLASIDTEVRLLEAQNKSKLEMFGRTKQMTMNVRKKTQNKLLDWAKDYLKINPSLDKLSAKLSDQDTLLLAFCGYKYSNYEIAIVLNTSQEMIFLRKLELREMFEKAGFSDAEIVEMLFLKNNSIFE